MHCKRIVILQGNAKISALQKIYIAKKCKISVAKIAGIWQRNAEITTWQGIWKNYKISTKIWNIAVLTELVQKIARLTKSVEM